MDPLPPVLPPPPTPAPRPPRWGLGDFVVGVLGGYALAGLGSALWFAISGEEEAGLAGQAFTQAGLWTGMVGTALVASRRKGAGTLAEDFGFRARGIDIGTGLLIGLAVQLVVLRVLAYLMRPLLGEPEVSGPVQDLLDMSQGLAFFGLILSVAVGAPLVEELFFRGLLLRALQRRMSDGMAVALSAVAFGLAHLSALPLKALALVVISLTVFGAILAVLAIRTGRLGASIVAHAVFNLFTLLVLKLT